ncbi:MAG: hypothetical protein NVS2B16_04950 [Chloroflexota bacterium]
MGHDFRPDYLRLGAVADALGRLTILALTATASPPVPEEIRERLHMRDPHVAVHGFDRPNIWLGVEKCQDERTKRRVFLKRVAATDKPGIVYTSTRKHAEETATALQEAGTRATHYHAGMRLHQRGEAQDAFMDDRVDVMVATSAFGMGVDKPNVRFVFHHDIPDSVDAYYQEIGRGDREGDPAVALLFYRPQDLGIHRFFAGGGQVDLEQIERVAEAVKHHDRPVDPRDPREEIDLSDAKLTTAISRLEDVGIVEVLPTGDVVESAEGKSDRMTVDEAVQAQQHHHAFAQSQIEMMRGYAEVWGCRRESLLNYFGEEFEGPCGCCHNCEAGRSHAAEAVHMPYPLNSRVMHVTFGEGAVQRYEGGEIIVLFDAVGYKTLLVDFVIETGAVKSLEAEEPGA